MKKILIAKILKPQGLKGEIKVKAFGDDLTVFDANNTLFLNNNTVTIEKSRVQKGFVYLKLQNFNSIEEVESLRNYNFYINEDELPKLEEDEYFVKDLINLKVYNQKEEYLGTVTEINNYGSADVYTIKNKGKTTEFAFVDGLFESVDYDSQKIVVNNQLFEEVVVWK